jgi:hypothetical protein
MEPTKKNIENLSNEQLAMMFRPVPQNETTWAERHQQIGMLFFGLPLLTLFFWFLFT